MRAWIQRAADRSSSFVSTAILLREATRSSRRWQTYAVRTLFSGLLASALLLSIQATVNAANTGLVDIAWMGRVGRGLFLGYAFVQMALVAIIAPLTTANAVREETEQRTLDLLLLTRLTPTQIVIGKVFSRIGILLTMVFGAMPVLLLAVNMGGVSGLDVVALTLHTLTVALMGAALGGFFALFTRSALLSTLAALAYGIPFYAVMPFAYALGVGNPESAAHFSPLLVAAAASPAALAAPIAYLPSFLVVVDLMSRTFGLRASGASFQEAYSHTLWRTNTWAKGLAVWVLLATPGFVLVPMAWIDNNANASWVAWGVAMAAGAYLWLLVTLGYGLLTWLYLRVSFDIVDALDGLFGRRGTLIPAEKVRIGYHPVWWRETRHGTITIGPVVATWGLLMLALLQTGWWLIPGGVLAMGVANALGNLVLTAWLGTRAFTEERRNRTLEGLVTTTMGDGRIVFDKLSAVLWPTFPLWLVTGPLLAFGVPHLHTLQFFSDRLPWQWSWLVSGFYAWAWSLPVWVAVAGASLVMGLRARNPGSAFGLVVAATTAALAPAAIVGQLLPDLPFFAPMARFWAPGLTGQAGVLHYLVSGAFWCTLALLFPVMLSRRLRAWALKVLVGLATLGAGLLAEPARAQAPASEAPTDLEARNQLAMDVRPWLDGYVRGGGWGGAVVELRNDGAPTEGRLALDDQLANEDAVLWARSVELAAGGSKRVFLPFVATNRRASRDLRFEATDGRFALGQVRLQPLEPSDVLIAVIGDDPLGLHAALRTATGTPVPRHGIDRLPDLPHRSTEAPSPEGGPRRVAATNLPYRDVPTSSQVLTGVDWIVWPDADPSRLSEAQSEALVNWVADGGHLFLTVTDTVRQLEDSPLADILPGHLGPPQVDGVQQLWARVEPPPDADVIHVVIPDTPVTHFLPRVGTQIYARTRTGQPLWVAAPRGEGSIHMLLADLSLAPFPSLDREALWRTLLWLPGDGTLPPGFPTTFDLGYGIHDEEGFGRHIRRILADVPGLAPLPMSWLVVAGFVYLLLIGPVDYFVLRWMRRQPLTWVTYPTTIVVFTVASIVALRSTKGSQAMLTRVELVDVMPDAGRWRGTSHIGVFSTRRTPLQVASGIPDAVLTPLDEPGFLPTPQLTAGYGPGSILYPAETWTMAYLRTEWVQPREGKLVVRRLSDGQLQVENQLGVDLEDLVLYEHDVPRANFGPVADGAVLSAPIGRAEALDIYRDPRDWRHEASRGARLHPALLVGLAHVPVDPVDLKGLSPVLRTDVVLRQVVTEAEMAEPTESP